MEPHHTMQPEGLESISQYNNISKKVKTGKNSQELLMTLKYDKICL